MEFSSVHLPVVVVVVVCVSSLLTRQMPDLGTALEMIHVETIKKKFSLSFSIF